MIVTKIPSTWETERFSIQDLKENEINEAQTLYEQGSYIYEWDGRSTDYDYAYRCFTEGDLPPFGVRDQFKIQVIRMKETDKIAGLLLSYHGYPTLDTFYINYLFIDTECHKQGIGQEVVYELVEILKDAKYREVRANVSLKNWPALRFWTKLGFNKINGVFGDKIHSNQHFADIELIKEL